MLSGRLFDKDVRVGDIWKRDEGTFQEYYEVSNIKGKIALFIKGEGRFASIPTKPQPVNDPYGTIDCWHLKSRKYEEIVVKSKKLKTNRLANL